MEMRNGSAVTESIFLDEIEQNQAMFKSCNVHHLILTYCLLNCCINLISHLQTPLIIFKSCHSLQFIAISQSSIIIKEALHTAQCMCIVMHSYGTWRSVQLKIYIKRSAFISVVLVIATNAFWGNHLFKVVILTITKLLTILKFFQYKINSLLQRQYCKLINCSAWWR